jgi:hypothetical protein
MQITIYEMVLMQKVVASGVRKGDSSSRDSILKTSDETEDRWMSSERRQCRKVIKQTESGREESVVFM